MKPYFGRKALKGTFATIFTATALLYGAQALTGDEISALTSTQAIELLCSGSLTAVEYATALLDREDRFQCINAFAHLEPSKVLEDAKAVDDAKAAGQDTGPLCGLAFAVKDNIDVLGYPTVAGTPVLEGMMPCNSSTLVTRLLEAHGVVLGKMRMHELAMGGTTINPFGGPTLNPYNNTMHVGGSSGGTTAAVAMRLAPAGFCSDTGGSCRLPASMTGVIGFRPTTGCWQAADGIVPMSTTRDTVGVNARSMADVKLFNSLFSDCSRAYPPVTARGLRVGVPRNFWEDLGWETEEVFAAALEAMRAGGVELVPMDMDLVIQLGKKDLPDTTFYTYEYPRELSRYMYTHGYNISLVDMVDKIASPLVKKFLTALTFRKLDTFPTPVDYARALGVSAPKLKALWESYHDTYSVSTIIVPTTPITSRPISDVEPYLTHNGKKWENYEVYGRTVKLDCALNIPGLAMPIGLASDGMPASIMFHARPGDDDTLLSVGEAMEELFAPTPPPPEVAACAGCVPGVKVVNVTWDGVGQPGPTDTTSCYELELGGDCALKSGTATA